MKLRGTILAGVTAATLLASGAVLASAINDLPQDAVPVQDPTAALNRQASPATTPPVEPAPEAAPAPTSPIAVTPADPAVVGAPGEALTPGGWLRILPSFWPEQGGLDGFFVAGLQRIG